MPENEKNENANANENNINNADTADDNNPNTQSTQNIQKPEESDESDESIKSVKSVKKPSDSMLKTAGSLGIITFITVLIIAISNSLASPVIEQKLKAEKVSSVINLFGEGIFPEELIGYEDIYAKFGSNVTEVLAVKKNGTNEIAGYCVTVAPKGFSGKITMLVAVNPDCTVKDTKILSMSETAGQGTKIESEGWFQAQFKNKSIEYLPDTGYIDIIANATVSSKAFFNGITSALSVVKEITAGNHNNYNARNDDRANGANDENNDININGNGGNGDNDGNGIEDNSGTE